MTSFQKPLGAGFNAREVESVPPGPEPKRSSEGAPATPNPGTYAGHGSAYPESRPGDRLEPAFARFSEQFAAGEAADAVIRERSIRESLGPTETERLHIHRALLSDQVRAGEIDNATANALFAKAHPGISPDTLKPYEEKS